LADMQEPRILTKFSCFSKLNCARMSTIGAINRLSSLKKPAIPAILQIDSTVTP